MFDVRHIFLFQQCKQYISQYGPLVIQQLMSMVSDLWITTVFICAVI